MQPYAVVIPMATTKIDDEVAPLFDALAHRRRRRVVAYVADRNGETTLDAVAEHLCDDCGEDRERVRVSLHHRHLPKLDDLGVLDYDDRANVVRPLALSDLATELLSLGRQADGNAE